MDPWCSKLFNPIVIGFSRYYSHHPQRFKEFHGAKLSPSAILCLLCSDLPMDQVKEILQETLDVSCIDSFFSSVTKSLQRVLDPSVPNQNSLGRRLLELIEHFKVIYLRRPSPSSSFALDMTIVLTKCRFEDYHLTKEGANEFVGEDKDPLKSNLCAILIQFGKFEEALRFLPSVAPHCLIVQFILANPSFCALLAEHNPELIRKSFESKLNQYLLFRDLNLVKAFFGTSSITQLSEKVSDDTTGTFPICLLRHGSFEEIREFLAQFTSKGLAWLYCSLSCVEDRAIDIVSIILSLQKDDLNEHLRKIKRLIHMEPHLIVGFIEKFGVEMFEKVWASRNTIMRCFLGSPTLYRILKLDELRARIMPFKEEILARFAWDGAKIANGMYSPNEICYAYQFYNMTPLGYIQAALKKALWSYLFQDKWMSRYVLNMISLSRSWYNADHKIAKYEGYDFVQRFFDEANNPSVPFCQMIYASLSDHGKTILKFVFAEAEKIKSAVIAETNLALIANQNQNEFADDED